MFEKRINIFTGHFGSGKTEVAVNYAFKLAERNSKVAIVDLDIVNPYFRTADAKKELENAGIKVILPMYANTNVDVPALPAEINTLFEEKDYKVVLDVGGDDLGARVLARYNDEIIHDDYEMHFVVNLKRPMTDTLEKVEMMIAEIEFSSKLKVTKLVNNTNMLHETNADEILKAQEIINEISSRLSIPVGFISGFDETLRTIPNNTGLELFPMKKYIKLPWET